MESIKQQEYTPTVKETIGELYIFEESDPEEKIISVEPKTDYQKYLRNGNQVLMNHDIHYPAKIQQERISYVPQGGNWRDVPEELWVTSRTTKTGRTNRHSSG